MPLGSYGVLIGVVEQFAREDPQPGHYGKYYHGKIKVNVNNAIYECAVDVATPSGANIQYRIHDKLDAAKFAPISQRANGIYLLGSGPQQGPTSGALDYVRSPLLKTGSTARRRFWPYIPFPITIFPFLNPARWITSDGSNALDVLEPMVPPGTQVYVFGEPFNVGLGMHNIHMNQGDPFSPNPSANHQHDDGVWQDGGTIVRKPNGDYSAFMNKFSTQSLNTDNVTGLPF